MNKSFVIYESAMCCSSGVCGPSPDQSLIQLQDTLEKIKQMGCNVERYSITQSPKKFRENPEILKLIQEHQIKALPITTYNGQVIKVGSYPTLDELKNLSQDDVRSEDISQKAVLMDEGCCSGKNYCDIRCAPDYKGDLSYGSNSRCC